MGNTNSENARVNMLTKLHKERCKTRSLVGAKSKAGSVLRTHHFTVRESKYVPTLASDRCKKSGRHYVKIGKNVVSGPYPTFQQAKIHADDRGGYVSIL